MAKKFRVPKRIAGIKIPRPIRKGPVGNFLNSSAGQVLVAEALLVAGAALVANRNDLASLGRGAARRPLAQLKAAGQAVAAKSGEAKDAIDESSSRLVNAFGQAVHAFRAALYDADAGRRDDEAGDDAPIGGRFANEGMPLEKKTITTENSVAGAATSSL